MPTRFTDCEECNYFIELEKYKDKHACFNELHKLHHENIEKQNILMKAFPIPEEIAIIIIKMSNELDLKQCGYCNAIVCNFHADRGLYFNTYFNKYFNKGDNTILCNNCRWYDTLI
jgi:hypothetical protein